MESQIWQATNREKLGSSPLGFHLIGSGTREAETRSNEIQPSSPFGLLFSRLSRPGLRSIGRATISTSHFAANRRWRSGYTGESDGGEADAPPFRLVVSGLPQACARVARRNRKVGGLGKVEGGRNRAGTTSRSSDALYAVAEDDMASSFRSVQ